MHYAMDPKILFDWISKNEVHYVKEKLPFENVDLHKYISKSQESALHLAVKSGSSSMVKLMLDNGFDIFLEYQNIDGKTPLHEASQMCAIEIVVLLLKKGANVDALKRADWTPLMLAVAKGHLEVSRRLIDGGASLDLQNKDGWTPFHIACRTRSLDVLETLLEHNPGIWCTRSKNGRNPMHTAALHGNTDVVQLLFKKSSFQGTEVDSCGNIPLMDAIRSGVLSCVRLLVNLCPRNVLHTADSLGHLPIHIAAESGHEDIVRFLIEQCGIDPNELTGNGESPLHFAAKENHVNILKFLYQHGADVNHRNLKMRTALWFATAAKKDQACEVLKQFGATDDPDENGLAPSRLISASRDANS